MKVGDIKIYRESLETKNWRHYVQRMSEEDGNECKLLEKDSYNRCFFVKFKSFNCWVRFEDLYSYEVVLF